MTVPVKIKLRNGVVDPEIFDRVSFCALHNPGKNLNLK